MASGLVVAWSHDVNKNVLGRFHANPVLDTVMYQVKFIGNKVTELATNAIAVSLYAQCDENGNEYTHIALLVDYLKDEKALSLSDQKDVATVQTSIFSLEGSNQTNGDDKMV